MLQVLAWRQFPDVEVVSDRNLHYTSAPVICVVFPAM